jgi:eukaryotic-like serine/threonine-protein kinase
VDTHPQELYRFGPFEVDPSERRLSREGTLVPLTPKAFEILLVLLQSAGHTVEKDRLLKEVWPDTFVEEGNLAVNIFALRKALGGANGDHEYIETVPKRGYRFVGKLSRVAPRNLEGRSAPHVSQRYRLWFTAMTTVILGILVFAGFSYWRSEKAKHLTEQDTVVLADFVNRTGDPVFDGTLRQALSVELTQSPFMNVASDVQLSEVLRRMGRPPGEAITRVVAAEACLRMGGKAVLAGSISNLGTHYVVGLEALGCARGNTLAISQAEAANKEKVLRALDQAASQVRRKIGESLSSLEKYDFPVDTTTQSLEALKAFSMGQKALRDTGEGEAIPFLQQAIQLDPDFALAYAVLGRAYENVGEDAAAIANFTRAFQLRDRLSEREKYHLTTLYHETVTGDLDQAKAAAELWVHTYPRDGFAREKLATVYGDLGRPEEAHAQAQEALRLDPNSTVNIFNAVSGAEALNRLDEARHILGEAQARGLDGPIIRESLYSLAFLLGDSAGMDRQVSWAIGRAEAEEMLLSQHSDTAAYYGKLHDARQLSRRAAESARRGQAREIAATCEMVAGLRDIETGNLTEGNKAVRSASLSPARDVRILAAFAFARIGDVHRALALINEIERQNPANTLVKYYWVPTVKAALELHTGQPQTAISLLETVAPYDWSQNSNLTNMWTGYPVYLRGEAYRLAHKPTDAAAEFNKLLAHRGLLLNSVLGALARLQLARADLQMGHPNDARNEYVTFLALWKEADPGIPILQEAKAEFAKL